MADPISNLKGDELPPVTLPIPTSFPPPEPEPAALPPLPTVTEAPAVPTFDLAPPPIEDVTRQLAPNIQARQFQVQQEANFGIDGAQEMPNIYQPPNLNEVFTGFAKTFEDRQRLLDLTLPNTRDRDVAQRMLESLEQIPPPKSFTDNAMAWVGQILGIQQEGGRTYSTPVLFDREKGEWRGAPVAAIVYALGLPQNTAMGAAIDLTNFASTAKRTMGGLYERSVPPWLRNQITSAADATIPLIPFAPLLRDVVKLIPDKNRYFDGKSNTVEALRGAQYGFSDPVGEGFGIKRDEGFRIGGAKNSGRFGFDFNPSLLAGVGLDILTGDVVDATLGRILKARRPVPTVPTRTQVSPPVPEPPLQLTLPFMLKPQKPKKAVLPKLNVLGTPLAKSKKPGFRGKPKGTQLEIPFQPAGQLELPLGKLVITPKQLELPLNLPDVPRTTPGQLKLDFDVLPEAYTPLRQVEVPAAKPLPTDVPLTREVLENLSVEELVKLTDEIGGGGTATSRAKILHEIAANVDTNVGDGLRILDGLPPIGREVLDGDLPPITRLVNPPTVKMAAVDVPPVMYHGSRVVNLDLPNIDPLTGAARSELGPGIYLTTDPEVAKNASRAMSNDNLPTIPDRIFGDPVMYTVDTSNLRLISGFTPDAKLSELAEKVATELNIDYIPGYPKSVTHILDDVAKLEYDEVTQLSFQRSFADELRNQGYDGVKANNTVAVYNPKSFGSVGGVAGEPVDDVTKMMASRARVDLDTVRQADSETAVVNAVESDIRHMVQYGDDVDQLKARVEQEVMDEVEADWVDTSVDDFPSDELVERLYNGPCGF